MPLALAMVFSTEQSFHLEVLIESKALNVKGMTSFIYPVIVAWTWNYGWLSEIFDVGSADAELEQPRGNLELAGSTQGRYSDIASRI